MRRLSLLTLLVIASGLLGPTAAAEHSPSLQYACHGDFPFDAWHFKDGRAEERRGEKAAALRRVLSSWSGEGMPQSGWRRVGFTETYADFVARDDQERFYAVLVHRQYGRWRAWSWGDCTPEAVIGNVSIVEWALDPESPPPLPDDKVIHALINERACHSFDDPLDRMKDPIVFYEEDRIYIVLSAEPLEGAQTCPGTPPVKFDIELDEPIGLRELWDAGTYPPQPGARTLD